MGWLKASLLYSGMTLLDRNNDELEVVSQHLIPNRLETVYNIEVEGFHTYHVGELGIWVHNANCCNVAPVVKVNHHQEIEELFDASNNRIGITIGNRSVLPDSNSTGFARIFHGISDKEVFDYFTHLTGQPLPAPRQIPGKGNLYTVKTSNGSFN